MRWAAVLGLVAAGFATAPSRADEQKPKEEAARVAARAAAASRLDLGPYARPYSTPPVESLMDLPRFASTVDVEGTAPPDPNVTMAALWAHWDLPHGSVYGKGIIYRKPPPPGSVDIIPLVNWIADKIKKK